MILILKSPCVGCDHEDEIKFTREKTGCADNCEELEKYQAAVVTHKGMWADKLQEKVIELRKDRRYTAENVIEAVLKAIPYIKKGELLNPKKHKSRELNVIRAVAVYIMAEELKIDHSIITQIFGWSRASTYNTVGRSQNLASRKDRNFCQARNLIVIVLNQ